MNAHDNGMDGRCQTNYFASMEVMEVTLLVHTIRTQILRRFKLITCKISNIPPHFSKNCFAATVKSCIVELFIVQNIFPVWKLRVVL